MRKQTAHCSRQHLPQDASILWIKKRLGIFFFDLERVVLWNSMIAFKDFDIKGGERET